jgi:hypothetical protein
MPRSCLASVPAAWGTYDLNQLGDGQTGVEGWQSVPARNAPVLLEVATRRLPGGVLLQVGRTTLERDRTLRQVRDLLGVLLGSVVVLGLIGGSAITWTTFAPLRHLLDTLREITRTGRFEARVPSDGGRDVLSELAQVSNQMLERIQTLVGGMRGALDSCCARSAHADCPPCAAAPRTRSSPRAMRAPAAKRSRTSSRSRTACRRCSPR